MSDGWEAGAVQAEAQGTAPLLPGSSSLKHSTLLPPTCPHPYQTNNTHLKSKKLSLRNLGSAKWQAGDCAGHTGPRVLVPLLLSPEASCAASDLTLGILRSLLKFPGGRLMP